MFKPKGIVIPVVTPIDDDGNFLEDEYKRLLQYFIDNGIHGVFPFGTSGEFYAFDNGFYKHVLEVTAECARGKMDIYAGANHITPKGAIELAKIAEDVKVDALSVLTPMFVSQTQKELEIYYRKIADATSLPIVIYNNKPKTNVGVDPATIKELAKVKNIIAVKDSTGDMTNAEEYIRLTRDNPDFCVLMGRDTLIYAALCYGAAGAITSCGNIAPRIAVDIYENFVNKNFDAALEAQFKLSALRIATNMGSFPVVVKEALNMIGYKVGKCAEPIQPLLPEQREKLTAVMKEIGLL
ncbi:MAG: dihydrodipicolinate synthase family protein [Synergistaceae bacterium]|nr:dihydrodipicolinate synthase family protein [Synergistaceae bacterium]MBQ6738735.1 dihydrodipicolinate synthase family protein [Synergistaceae bacterium]MBQ7067611.1 dihydrodipicolinate synthase family protein [Synergistaceae bacterium]MBR0234460.1 dihydrodipicolinate synthase family protein [Synergistaceae bacterium]MBR0253263.1 dihydrodipicolinate synthase family protein [Synergistaceae bacterium]